MMRDGGGFFGGEPMQPFLWGAGGRRVSADDLDLERRLAAQQMAQGADFSPVASPWQGLARVANGALGGFRMQEANETAAEQSDVRQAILESIMAGGDTEGSADPVAAALADPELRDFGMAAWKARQPKQTEPPEIIQLAQIANDPARPEWERKAAADAVAAKNDPMTTATVGDVFFSGRSSQLPALLGEAGYSAVGNGPPDTLPPDFNFDEPQMPAQANPALEQFKSVYGPEEGERRYNALVGGF